MTSRALVGGDRVDGWDYLPLEQTQQLVGTNASYDQVRLGPPIDGLGDLWPILRFCRAILATGGSLLLTSRQRGSLHCDDLTNLLQLNALQPVTTQSDGDSIEVEAIASELNAEPLSCTVVIPCRNEVGNIEGLVRRTPNIGTHTQMLFVDGNSTDGTQERIQEQIDLHPERDIALLHQKGAGGKAEAVFLGFDAAKGDVVIILDADMTVAPEDLPRFYLAVAEGVADFANGSRFLYPMERGAMRIVNNAGNRIFCGYLSWLIGTRITDTLCGTKAMRRSGWQRIREARPVFGGHDPWGDFDLLLGAAYTGLRIADVPIVYGARTAGESKMHAFSHGAELAKTCFAGFTALKLRRSPPERR